MLKYYDTIFLPEFSLSGLEYKEYEDDHVKNICLKIEEYLDNITEQENAKWYDTEYDFDSIGYRYCDFCEKYADCIEVKIFLMF